ncbi:F-box/kelch-repeat protein SKIP25-like [Magnolia sinica]|uniref:F-box/kelch-repeat protein SKIP25-like n=1 Tax=Magnolia sinica TaxID=86752 RepID=UPI0026580043|nr:F-box/kelch-repeat protein SKIP25-like [Magnolia sinica]
MADEPTTSSRRSKLSDQPEQQPLLPGLPDHLAHLCLALVPPPLLYSVSRSWRRLLYSPSFPPFLSLYALLSFQNPITNRLDHITFSSYDPISATWHLLPPPPPDLPLPSFLLCHTSFIARCLPIQSVSLSGHLLLLSGTTHGLRPALHRPLIFHPVSNRWRHGPPIPSPRRWCAAGGAGGAVYMASGIGTDYSPSVARSVERWDLVGPAWEKVAPLRDGKFSREAVEAIGLRGKLCMVNVKGNAAKQGVVYDIGSNRWEEMPQGMLAGWNGPASALDEDVMYVIDEARGALIEYNGEEDRWREILQLEALKGAVQIDAGGGRVCIVCAGGTRIAVAAVVERPARMWFVDPPPGTRAVAVHVLPRMSMVES